LSSIMLRLSVVGSRIACNRVAVAYHARYFAAASGSGKSVPPQNILKKDATPEQNILKKDTAPEQNILQKSVFQGEGGKLAERLYNIAVKVDQADIFREELQRLGHVLSNNAQFREHVVAIPTEEIPEGDLTRALIDYLKFSGKTDQLLAVCKSFENGMRNLKNESFLSLTVAHEPDEELRANAIKQLSSGDSTVVLDITVDSRILGGYILRSDDKELDMSHRTMLNVVKQSVMNTLQDAFTDRIQAIRRDLAQDKGVTDVEFQKQIRTNLAQFEEAMNLKL